MDKEFRKEIRSAEYKEWEISCSIRKIEDFIQEKGKYYKNEASIEVLNKMKESLKEKKEQYRILEDQNKKMRRKFQESCLHEVTIEDDLNCFCAFCNRLMIYDNPNTILKIKLPFNMGSIGKEAMIYSSDQCNSERIQDRIYKIIEKGLESEDALTYIEDSLEDLQYTSNIKVRRLR